MSSDNTDTKQTSPPQTVNPATEIEKQLAERSPFDPVRLASELSPEDAVTYFMYAGKQKMPSRKTAILYRRLLAEEMDETAVAEENLRDIEIKYATFTDAGKERYIRELAEYFDGIFDTIWVGLGFCNACGISFDEIWTEGTISNLRKIDFVTGFLEKDANGKIMKPAEWKKPDFRQFAEKAYKNLYEEKDENAA